MITFRILEFSLTRQSRESFRRQTHGTWSNRHSRDQPASLAYPGAPGAGRADGLGGARSWKQSVTTKITRVDENYRKIIFVDTNFRRHRPFGGGRTRNRLGSSTVMPWARAKQPEGLQKAFWTSGGGAGTPAVHVDENYQKT